MPSRPNMLGRATRTQYVPPDVSGAGAETHSVDFEDRGLPQRAHLSTVRDFGITRNTLEAEVHGLAGPHRPLAPPHGEVHPLG